MYRRRKQPKLTADDYKADLDAVNLSKRLEEEDNLILVMNRYYGEIGTGKANRAEEFVTNMGQVFVGPTPFISYQRLLYSSLIK